MMRVQCYTDSPSASSDALLYGYTTSSDRLSLFINNFNNMALNNPDWVCTTVTNIPKIVELKHTISAREYEEAGTLLENLSPAKEIEFYITRTSELFLNHLNDVGVFEINDEILPEIRSIAVLNGWDYGRGVYMARALMDTTIEFNLAPVEERLTLPIGKNIVVNPNPAYDFIQLQYTNGKPLTEIQSVEVCDLSGAVVKRFSKPTNIMDISAVQGGIYLIRVNMPQGHQSIIKLQIL